MDRGSFWELVEYVRSADAFKKHRKGPRDAPVAHQLLVLLKCYGTEGNQASSMSLGNFFGVGTGTVNSHRDNALRGLLTLEGKTYMWPDEKERETIAKRIQVEYKFPNCVGLIDGTLLPLAEKPLLFGENYHSRKNFYALVMLVVCDDLCRILYYHVG